MGIDKINLKFIWKFKDTRIAKILRKYKKKLGGIILSDIKAYYIPTVIKTVLYGSGIDTQINETEQKSQK